MDWDIQVVFGVIENNLVQLSSVTVEYRSVGILLWGRLRDDVFASIFVNAEAVFPKVNAEGSHFIGDFTIYTPSPKDASCI